MNTARLLDVSVAREAPPEVVAELRSIDPRVDVVYIGKGKWWTGMVYSNIQLIHMGRDSLLRIQAEGGASWPTLRLAQLKSQGFRMVKLLDVDAAGNWVELARWPRDPHWGRVVNAFRRQDWIFRHFPNSDAAWLRLMLRHELGQETAAETAAVSRALDMVHADRKSLMRVIKGNRLFGWRKAG